MPKTTVKIRARYRAGDVKTLLLIVFRLGIADKDRRYFWKLVTWSLLHNRKMLDKTLLYGLMIYQMRETYEVIRKKAATELRYYEKRKYA